MLPILTFVVDPTKNLMNVRGDNTILYAPKVPKNYPIENNLKWIGTCDGWYIVRSAYCLLMSRPEMQQLASTNRSGSEARWKQLWLTNVPPKTKHFIWWVMTNRLPTKSNLHRRGIPITEIYDQCGKDVEDITHAIWTCPTAKIVWENCTIRAEKIVALEYKEFKDVTEVVLNGVNKETQELFMIIAWRFGLAGIRLFICLDPLKQIV